MNVFGFSKITKLTLLLVLNLLCVSQIGFSQTFVEKHGRLQTQGNRIVDKNGEVVSLAGNSLFWSIAGDISDFYNADAVEHVAKNWNSAIIRIAMGIEMPWDNGLGYNDNPEYQIKKITPVIEAAIDQGIYVIIDWHAHDAELYTRKAAGFFKEMAALYGDKPNVIYEIYNEPINQSWPTIKNYAETVIDAIRSEDPDNLIVVGTGFYSQEVDEASLDPITDNNLAYTLHFYAATHKQELRNRAITALSNGIPLFVTEWGAVQASGDGAIDYEETQKWMDFMKQNGISHASWSLSDKPSNTNGNVLEGSAQVELRGGVAALQQDRLSEYGVMVKDIILNWTDFRSSVEEGSVGTLTIVDFDTKTTEMTPFNDAQVRVIDNPQLNGINAEPSKVLEVKNFAQTDFEGASTGIIDLIDFGPNSTKTIFVDVYSETPVSVDVQVKAIDVDGNIVASPRGASKVVGHTGSGWERLEVDYNSLANKSYDGFDDDGDAPFVPEGLYGQISFLISPGAPSPNGAATYYVDNFRLKTSETATDPNTGGDTGTTNEAPTVAVTSPANNATFTLGETITITATASDDNAVTKVNFKIDDSFHSQDATAPYSSTFTPTVAGTYKIAARAFDAESLASEEFITINVEAPTNTGGGNTSSSCKFNTPATESLPSMDTKFENVYALGDEAPDVSNIRSFTINWNLPQNGLYQFALNTENGVPSHYVDLANKIDYNFANAEPEVSIANSGITGLDGNYWVTADQGNLVMVSKDKDYTLYFSNDANAPECEATLSNVVFFAENIAAVKVYPNPATNNIQVTGLIAAGEATIIDITGKVVFTASVSETNSNIDITSLSNGVYFLSLKGGNSQKTITFIKK